MQRLVLKFLSTFEHEIAAREMGWDCLTWHRLGTAKIAICCCQSKGYWTWLRRCGQRGLWLACRTCLSLLWISLHKSWNLAMHQGEGMHGCMGTNQRRERASQAVPRCDGRYTSRSLDAKPIWMSDSMKWRLDLPRRWLTSVFQLRMMPSRPMMGKFLVGRCWRQRSWAHTWSGNLCRPVESMELTSVFRAF